jgi:hypothetical protein
MTKKASFATLLSPTTIAIHNDSYMQVLGILKGKSGI